MLAAGGSSTCPCHGPQRAVRRHQHPLAGERVEAAVRMLRRARPSPCSPAQCSCAARRCSRLCTTTTPRRKTPRRTLCHLSSLRNSSSRFRTGTFVWHAPSSTFATGDCLQRRHTAESNPSQEGLASTPSDYGALYASRGARPRLTASGGMLRISDKRGQRLRRRRVSPDGEQGYPRTLLVTVTRPGASIRGTHRLTSSTEQLRERRVPQGQDVSIAIIGSGFGGLGTAIRLKQQGLDDFVVLERAGDVGGTWRDNTYPGCACDVQSHLYSFSFAPNPDWSRSFARSRRSRRYLQRCAARVRHPARTSAFTTRSRTRAWDGDARRWRIQTSRGPLAAQVLVMAAGGLSDPRGPRPAGAGRVPGPRLPLRALGPRATTCGASGWR